MALLQSVVTPNSFTYVSHSEFISESHSLLYSLICSSVNQSIAISTKVGRELPNGFFYTITHQLVEFQDGRNFEGVGVPPDFYMKNTATGISSGVDETLEYALSLF